MLIIAGIIVSIAVAVWLLVSVAICNDMRERRVLNAWDGAKVFAWPAMLAWWVTVLIVGTVLNFCGIDNDWGL